VLAYYYVMIQSVYIVGKDRQAGGYSRDHHRGGEVSQSRFCQRHLVNKTLSDARLAFVNFFFSPTISLGLLRSAVRKTPSYMRAFTCYWGCILCCVGIIHSYIIRRAGDSFVQMLWNNLSRDCRSAAVGLVDYPIHIYIYIIVYGIIFVCV